MRHAAAAVVLGRPRRSTVDVPSVDGKGRWGEAIEDNVAYLSYYGVMPMDELLLASQDEALHGNNSITRKRGRSFTT